MTACWRATPTLGALSGAAYVLIRLGPDTIEGAQRAATSEALVTAGCELAGLVLLAWLVGAVVLSLAGALPGWVGEGAGALAQRVTPALVRTAVRASLGLALAAVAPVPALAAPANSPHPGWPALDRAPAVTVLATPKADRAYVVRPGDTLWDIAARHLGARPTAADIAEAWPAWWAVNLDVVGDNPDLIHPGQRLTSPTESRP